jgi:hypothetical protein
VKHVSPAGASHDEALTSTRVRVARDAREYNDLARREGWTDGLPVFPPTEDAVRALLDATPYGASDVIGVLAPKRRDCTVELAAVSAAMAGVEPVGFPYVIAALEAMCEEPFSLPGVATTTGSVAPMVIVNGPSRDRAGIDYRDGCLGGAAGAGSATIGRALMLCLRNVGGQLVGDTSRSVFGQPARSAGLCFGEWEEQSPWPSLSEQRGFDRDDDVVTLHGGMGTHAMADINCDDERELLMLLAKSICFPLGNKFLAPTAGKGETVLVLNPKWAQRFGRVFPDIADCQAFLHEHAWQPIDSWPPSGREILERRDRVDPDGRVRLNDRPDQIVLVVCGGLGNLHAVALPSWADSESVTWKVLHRG